VYVVEGGDGKGGNYVFADLAELDAIIAEWVSIRDGVEADRWKLEQARKMITPPAKDLMSQMQPGAVRESLGKAIKHNKAMWTYADGYVRRLQAAREQYVAGEEGNVARLRGVDAG
jgi:hypothetical protein